MLKKIALIVLMIAIFVFILGMIASLYVDYQNEVHGYINIDEYENADSTIWNNGDLYTFNDSTRRDFIKKGYKITDDYYDDDGSHITWFKK